MKGILLYLHQLPQNIVGFIISRMASSKCRICCHDDTIVNVYFKNNFYKSAVSLGNYIIMDDKTFREESAMFDFTLNHEHGHQIQSKYLGWFYLPIVGVISLFNNIWDRVMHKDWEDVDRLKWYHSRFPENWADKLAKLK